MNPLMMALRQRLMGAQGMPGGIPQAPAMGMQAPAMGAAPVAPQMPPPELLAALKRKRAKAGPKIGL